MKQGGSDKTGAEWMGLRQVTEYANVSERTVRAWIHSPLDPLPAAKVRGKILVRKSDFDAFLERHRVKPMGSVDLGGMVEEIVREVSRN
jgi:excisionase family DNA binding protein